MGSAPRESRRGELRWPLAGERETVNLTDLTATHVLPDGPIFRSAIRMEEGRLTLALDRAESALARIERAIPQVSRAGGKDEELRTRVREAVAELDQIIRTAENA
jgi:hypothetical protein